ncbi:carboxylating nicotinate-nucleotide diphosphorylase [Alcaligenaceae bacterium]|nr:carboxylating nicotinate-nucleotide diphosphorylase [Alcaligenaceae bacterium]
MSINSFSSGAESVDTATTPSASQNTHPRTPPLPRLMLEPLVKSALLEDLGRAGDLTSDAIIPEHTSASMRLVARQEGVLAGLDLARMAFECMDPQVQIRIVREDGTRLSAGDEIAIIKGNARALLGAERTALNFLCHLSGVASATASISDAIRPYGTRISCTRKTAPGLRAVQKYAVRVGGGSNHRFGLDDAVLIKDNHIVVAGSVREAVQRARLGVGHMVRIQLEVDTLAQLQEALGLGVDAVLLDNMSLDMLREAVVLVDGRAITEASGRITAETAPAVAQTGVNLIAVGWITHSAPILDIGLDADHD